MNAELNRVVRSLLAWTVAFGLTAGVVSAQTQPDDSGITPLGMAHGSPAGSYALSDFDNINLFSGALSVHLPLMKIGGRGASGTTVNLVIEQHWGLKPNKENPPHYFARFNWFRGLRPGYGPGTMRVYRDTNDIGQKLTRMTFTSGDQTQYEFRDRTTDGGLRNPSPIFNRGTEFWTRDGSAATFMSDTDVTDGTPLTGPSGFLYWRDGTTYRIEGGLVAWIRDRNGNNTTFAYESTPHDATLGPQVLTIADSLGRQVSFTYDTANQRDIIDFTGFGGAARSVVVHYAPLSQRLSGPLPSGCGSAPCRYAELFPEINWGLPFATGGTQQFFDPLVAADVVLPNNQSYTFTYNAYGEVAAVTLPTGGSFGYSYQSGLPPNGTNVYGDGVVDGNRIYRRLAQKTVTDGSVVMKTNYGQQSDLTDPFFGNSAESIVVEHYDPGNGDALIARDRHLFFGRGDSNLVAESTDYPVWRHAKEYRTELYSAQGALLRATEHTWAQKDVWVPNPNADAPAVDPRILTTATALYDVTPNLVSYQHFAYDTYNNRTATAELDFGQGPLSSFSGCITASAFARCHETDYFTGYAEGTAIRIRDLPLDERTYEMVSGTPTLKARTLYEYDNYSNVPNHAALIDRPGILHLDASFTTGYAPRGNLTAISRCKDTPPNCTAVAATFVQYDVAGNVVKRIDPRGFATTIDYDDNFGSPNASVTDTGSFPTTFALPTQVLNALSHRTRTQFDYWTGQAVDQEDPNLVVSTAVYGEGDALDRLTTFIRANSVSATRSQARFVYDNANRRIQTFRDLSAFNDQQEREDLLYDGLGRETKVRSFETASAYIEVRTFYDALGRVRQKSNPFRPASEGVVYTTTDYDALGRVVRVETPDTAAVQTTYAGNQTTVTDPALKVRRTTTDALGRMTQVVEDPAGRNYATSYVYDAFDHVKQVSQGTQSRTFDYDPLQRLVSTSNPESGETIYTYDDAGNLTQKRDGRALSANTAGITYGYDELNRVISKTFAFPSGVATTPAATYAYDAPGVSNSVGRLTSVSSSASITSVLAYDAVGRVTSSRQTTSGTSYPFSYTYDRAGNLRTETYPSGRVVTTNYDILNRLANLNTLSDATRTYADAVTYASHGATNQVRLGNGRWEKAAFNSRLQPTQIALGASQGATDLLRLDYGYGGTSNNGNVLTQTITVPGASFSQGYGYDGLNRLETASETPSNGTPWSQNYDHDRWGNHWVTGSSGYGLSSLTPTSGSAFSASTNRLNASSYDLAGNQTVDGQARSFIYDGENRQTTGPGGATYVYDGDGRRVSRTIAGATTTFVYDALGRLGAEYGMTSAPSAINYISQDYLGSTRVVTDSVGALIGRHDFLPYGEEIPTSLGNRNAIAGYNATDALRQKFTGKERDGESGLDFFLARYASAAQGRFQSTDPVLNADASTGDPQLLNRYSYVTGNPLKFIDPDGRDSVWAAVGPSASADSLELATGRITAQEYNTRLRQQTVAAVVVAGAPLIAAAAAEAAPGLLASAAVFLASPQARQLESTVGEMLSPVPMGFVGPAQFAQFGRAVESGLETAGASGAKAFLTGSAVTGRSFRTGAAFDAGRTSDFDVALVSKDLLAKASELGMGLRSSGGRTGPLSQSQLKSLGLAELGRSLSTLAGRPVRFMIYGTQELLEARGAPTVPLKK